MAAISCQPHSRSFFNDVEVLSERCSLCTVPRAANKQTVRDVGQGQWKPPRCLGAKLGGGLAGGCASSVPILFEGSSDGAVHSRKAGEELLWQQFFLDPTQWVDCRREKQTPGCPDFRHKDSKKALWLNNMHKPGWVEARLAERDMQQVDVVTMTWPNPVSTSNSMYPCRATQGIESGVSVEACREQCDKGQLVDAVESLELLVRGGGCRVPTSLVCSVLKACMAKKNMVLGRRVHSVAVQGGHESNTYLANHILRMYSSQGMLQEARDVFARIAAPDVFSWSSIILAHAERGEPKQAICLYQQMRSSSSAEPDGHVFVAALKACAAACDLESGRQVHADFMESRHQPNIFVGTGLVAMYAKCEQLEEARKVFDSLPTKDVVTWTAMIGGYAEHGQGKEALALYARMEEEGMVVSNSVTFACLLKACTSVGALQQGKHLHAQIVRRGLHTHTLVGTCLVNMYAKCGSLEDARQVFNELPAKDVVTWTAMIAGYAERGLGHEALVVHAMMEQEGGMSVADGWTFACLLKACGSVRALAQGKQLHSQILERGLDHDLVVGSCLVDMYAKCGSLDDARVVFEKMPKKNIITWNSLINGYTEHGQGQAALDLYARFEEDGKLMLADSVTFSCLLRACASIGALQEGKRLHSQIVERGMMTSDIVVGNCLVDMYAKCGSLDDARTVFEELGTSRDVVTWNSMIHGFMEQGLGQEALALYASMQQRESDRRVTANNITFASLLKACTSVGALQQGKLLHSQILESGSESDVVVGSCLVDMYAKCGSLEDARNVFDALPNKDVIVWNTMINGYGQGNEGRKAIECFQEMLRAGIKPNEATFTCLLVACSHEGLVSDGRHYFSAMVSDHGMVPSRQHYVCMVDLLGRAGRLDEAEELLVSMPHELEAVGWTSLLTACKNHKDMDRGRRCFERLIRLDPQSAGAYVLMANMYADASMWAEVDRVESLRRSAGASKKPAEAGIEVNRQVHTFVVGEERDHVSSRWKSMNVHLKADGGHVPHTQLVLKPVGDKDKEDQLCGHAEKLALAYGLLNTPDGATLLVTKNLRMCGDCHSATKVMSRIEKRDIVVRDAHRVHRFAKGSCSCGDRP